MTPKRRAELRALLATAPEFIREDPLVRDMPAILDALDLAEARERRLREALEFYANPEVYKRSVHGPGFDRFGDLYHHARAALSEVAPDAR